jgi:hypothetical protein
MNKLGGEFDYVLINTGYEDRIGKSLIKHLRDQSNVIEFDISGYNYDKYHTIPRTISTKTFIEDDTKILTSIQRAGVLFKSINHACGFSIGQAFDIGKMFFDLPQEHYYCCLFDITDIEVVDIGDKRILILEFDSESG